MIRKYNLMRLSLTPAGQTFSLRPGYKNYYSQFLFFASSLLLHGRFFYIERATLNPLTTLCKKLFPAIGEGHDRLVAKELSPGDPIRPTVAENASVQVIMMLRKTFIQEPALMMDLHPCYPIWQHSIFSDPAYLSFKR
ncbi:hypothetical protein [Absidia glauca]|uniref:Ndc10 domain-containing protein n=1 Tax=Absidia glauca TaxID=4829 RepID=A0A163JU53_ABSGL|nr:hypothetical protein [Absidia glauca]